MTLLARLQAATGPSYALDVEIAAHIYAENGLPPPTPPRPYSYSIDAALSWMPEGHWWSAGDCRREKHARVAPEQIDHDGYEGFGATVPLSLCIAIAKARGIE